MLPQFFDLPAGTKALSVKEGDTLELGHHTLTFVMAPMVHWPDPGQLHPNGKGTL